MVATCTGDHKHRLIIGDGNFSYTAALINKHDEKAGHTSENSLGHRIVTTEYKRDFRCLPCRKKEIEEICQDCLPVHTRLENLKEKKVTVLFGVDGTKLHINEELKKLNRHFTRIHWNCPHDGSEPNDQTLPKMLREFFQSCRQLQKKGDRIHLTLAQPKDKRIWYQAVYYGVVRASRAGGYELIKKRNFRTKPVSKARYPGYVHKMTLSKKSAEVTKDLREFVFEKRSLKSQDKRLKESSKKAYSIGERVYTFYEEVVVDEDQHLKVPDQVEREHFICPSEDESSDYETS